MSYVTTYKPMSIEFEYGKGIWLYDKHNTPFLDSFSGIAVTGLGHSHPEIVKNIQMQASKLIHTSNAVHIKEQTELAATITEKTNMKQVFFSNSGAEAVEAAIKLARLHGHQHKVKNPTILVMEGAFHGRTMATLSASGSRKVQAGFEPLCPSYVRAPFNDIDAIKKISNNCHDIVAVMLEPIQGESGIHEGHADYLHALSQLCHEKNWLLMFDEVQTGNGRLGALYAFLKLGIKPDVVSTAKGLGNGMPIGATLINGKACDLFQPGNHGSTFGGNPLACKTATTVLNIIDDPDFLQQVEKNSAYLKELLFEHFDKKPFVRGIRGQGFMLGIELDRPAMALKSIALKQQLLLNVTAENVIRLLPPLIIEKDDIETLVARLKKCVDMFLAQ